MSTSYHTGNITLEQDGVVVAEYDTFMCRHCNNIITVERSGDTNLWSPPEKLAMIGGTPAQAAARNKRRRGFCFRCMGPTCGRHKCARCIPFEAQLEAQEGTRRFWKQMEILS